MKSVKPSTHVNRHNLEDCKTCIHANSCVHQIHVFLLTRINTSGPSPVLPTPVTDEGVSSANSVDAGKDNVHDWSFALL